MTTIMMSLNSESLLHLLVGSDKEACAVEDPPKTAEELNKAQQQQPIEEGVTQVEGFLGGPHDISFERF